MTETPEQRAHQTIDALLGRCGWVVQDKGDVNLSAARGVAVSELSFQTGEPDYTLFVDGKALGTVEAKPEGHFLTTRLDSEIFLHCGNLRFAWITVLGNKIAGEAGQMVIVYHLNSSLAARDRFAGAGKVMIWIVS